MCVYMCVIACVYVCEGQRSALGIFLNISLLYLILLF